MTLILIFLLFFLHLGKLLQIQIYSVLFFHIRICQRYILVSGENNLTLLYILKLYLAYNHI